MKELDIYLTLVRVTHPFGEGPGKSQGYTCTYIEDPFFKATSLSLCLIL